MYELNENKSINCNSKLAIYGHASNGIIVCGVYCVLELRIYSENFVCVLPTQHVHTEIERVVRKLEKENPHGKEGGKTPNTIIVCRETIYNSNLTLFNICMKFNKLSFHLTIENSSCAALSC